MSKAPGAESPADEDSVRAYYRKLGRVPLLTREGEVALARCIEQAEGRIVRALVASPFAVQELSAIGDELKAAKLRARDVTRNPADEEDEDAARSRLLELFGPVHDLQRALRRRVTALAAKRTRASSRSARSTRARACSSPISFRRATSA
jgi:RNA polymerase primary sigma factor